MLVCERGRRALLLPLRPPRPFLQLLPHRPSGSIDWGALLCPECWQAQERAEQQPPFTAIPTCFFDPTWLT